MLNITTIAPAVWSPPPGPAVTAVSPITQVQPTQGTSRDAQNGMGHPGRDSASAAQATRAGTPRPGRDAVRSEKGSLPDAAPLLPRESSDVPEVPETPDGAEVKADAERELQARQAEDKAFRQKLQDVISNVWKASAAVVDVALGARNAEVADQTGWDSSGDIVTGVGPVVPDAPAAPAGLPAAPEQEAANDEVASLVERRADQEVVAYDAAGHSSLAPLEAGTLISHRV